jgi:hypothetical protein
MQRVRSEEKKADAAEGVAGSAKEIKKIGGAPSGANAILNSRSSAS